VNPVVIVHLLAAVAAVAAAVPLIQGKVKMNPWYGVRIPAAFESDERWFEINRHGGRLLFAWGVAIAVTALVGAFLKRRAWVTYDWTALVIIMGGLALVVAQIYRHARKNEKS
jgi:hypothetical protein